MPDGRERLYAECPPCNAFVLEDFNNLCKKENDCKRGLIFLVNNALGIYGRRTIFKSNGHVRRTWKSLSKYSTSNVNGGSNTLVYILIRWFTDSYTSFLFSETKWG